MALKITTYLSKKNKGQIKPFKLFILLKWNYALPPNNSYAQVFSMKTPKTDKANPPTTTVYFSTDYPLTNFMQELEKKKKLIFKNF